MGEREELNRQHSLWIVRRQEAENKLKEIEPKAEDVSGSKNMRSFVLTAEKMAEIENVRREIEEAEANIKEIRQKLKKLPPQKR